ncbi:transcriptional regulator, AraC family [Anaeromyxobacter dehalogenans 2CP-1]|uniref:Transcriptional regulator, AraC family n=1 Tax=Anaeromyxobacter dehalogenans (strain ATCC BAA-258 / DSM 21875 / 2CP-1) TaxID=455488 RepID=B8JHL7_ANAD2|nr:AraC family transcriptional regulator [Anaeromyxobacter dehalogenans]ACL66729.1 transcriptional regulator, AraC family [Anaeromyxobacter dehalogenans 2CP-1]
MPSDQTGTSLDAIRAALARTIGRWTEGVEDRSTPIADLLFFRREGPTPPGICRVEPSVVLVVQGKKRMLAGDDAYAYDRDHFLIASLDVPASSQVLEASPKRPCLGLTLKLDLRLLAELVPQVHLAAREERSAAKGMALGAVTPPLLDAFMRLTDLLDEPDAIDVLAPLVRRELHYRLLTSDQAGRLRQIASVGSQSHAIARAIEWLKVNYAAPLRIAELAARVHMSPSSLHQHFRQLTAMSPLQYQKWLRLNEARRVMLNEGFDAAGAAFKVGYESPSQFSREYARLFGAPPRRHVVSLRSKAAASQLSP